MGIQHPTAKDAALARMRARFVDGNRLKDYRLSAYNLMRMVRSVTTDRGVIAEIRERFLPDAANWIQWPGETWDHCELYGRDRQPLCLVSHPYTPPSADCPDLALLERAGLDVFLGSQDDSWYGHGSYQVRVSHPALSGLFAPRPSPPAFRPSPTSDRLPGESPFQARLRRAGPELLSLARERADELAASIQLVPCVGPRGVGPCVSCEMRAEYDRIAAVIREVEGV